MRYKEGEEEIKREGGRWMDKKGERKGWRWRGKGGGGVD